MIDVYEQFMTAVVENDVREVTRLIELGIDLNHRCDQGASALSGRRYTYTKVGLVR